MKARAEKSVSELTIYGECLASLGTAMEQSGGSISYWQLEHMSALKLIHLIAPNGIKFGYEKESE